MSSDAMRTPGMSLVDVQREMAAAVMMPLTASEEMRTTAPDGRAMNEVASSFVAPNSRLSAFERLEIYNRQYWFRVLGALAEDFPGLRAVLGGSRFEAMSVAYLSAHPSRSFTLRNLGSNLVEWLREHPEWGRRRHALAVEVARVEWAFVEAFDNGERTPLTLDQITTLDGGSRLALQPHVRLLALAYPADEIVLALHQRDKRQTSEAGVKHEDDNDAPARLPRLRRRATWVAAHRVDFNVYYRRLEREEFVTLDAIREGRPLIEALESGFAESQIGEARRPVRVREWFTAWAELGWICAPDLEELIQS
jgi:hypothetical protein